jgi:hypothetical protein
MTLESDSPGKPEQSELLYRNINKSTQTLGSEIYIHPENSYLHPNLPPKIRKRLMLNLSGINGLATTIVPPQKRRCLDSESLEKIIEFSNIVNKGLGLPETNDLILRSASHAKPSRVSASEPALLIKDVGKQNQKMEIHTDDNIPRNINSLKSFEKTLKDDAYLIIHDDNYPLQRKSIHGQLLIGEVTELVIATNSLHARNLTTSGIPFIKINPTYPEDLFKLDPLMLEAKIRNGFDRLKSPRIDITAGNIQNVSTVSKMVRDVNRVSDLVANCYQRISRLFGNGCVMEFRLYPQSNRLSDINRLHVLDVDKSF